MRLADPTRTGARREQKERSALWRFRLQRLGQFAIIALLLMLMAVDGEAQKRKKKPARNPQSEMTARVAQAKDDLVAAARAYKESLEKLLALQDDEAKMKAETVEKRKALVEQQIASRRELEESERELAAAQSKAAETRRQMAETDHLIAEATAEKQLALMPPPRVGSTTSSAALIRYNGPSRWLLADAAKVQSFFLGQFHRALPISAFGQTAVHTQLNFDHSNSMDVAVHPDSAEGQALMSFLRSQGIPFIAFRQAVAGSATGAHIHIGYPSHRIR